MSAGDHLGKYAQGWTGGEAETILSAAADEFVFDDPNAGQIAKADFKDYLGGLKAAVSGIRGADFQGPFMDLSEVVTQEEAGVITAWCWWAIPGTELKGGGLIKVGADEREVQATFKDRRWVFPRDNCVLLPVANTTAELVARYIGERLRGDLMSRTGVRPYRVQVSLDENNGQWAICELRDESS